MMTAEEDEGTAASAAEPIFNGPVPRSPVRSPGRGSAADSARRSAADRSRSKQAGRGAAKSANYDMPRLLKEHSEDIKRNIKYVHDSHK